MKQLIVLIIIIAPLVKHVNGQADTEKVLRNVSGYVINNTTFQFENTKTREVYNTTKNLEYSPDIKAKSGYNLWRYWNGVLNIGMVELGNYLDDSIYLDYSKQNFQFIFENLPYFEQQFNNKVKNSTFFQHFRLSKLDDCGAMAASLLDIYPLDPKKQYRDYVEKVGDYMLNKQAKLSDGTFCRPSPRKYTIWADDLYMSVPFLARMGKLTGNPEYFDFAVMQVENFAKYLYNPANGLYFHCWYSDVKLNGVAHWGRCNGWVMVATTELLNYLPENHPKRDKLIALLLRQIVGVSRVQDQSGLWHQVLDKPDSYLESSCTAMFVYSVARAVNQGWIDKSYLSIANLGWDGLLSKIQSDGQVEDICIGTGIRNDINYYYNRPVKLNDEHGLGAVLLAGIEMAKTK